MLVRNNATVGWGFEYGVFDYPVELVRSTRRKSVSIQVADGLIQLRVPQSISKREIEQLLERKRRWIEGKVALQSALPRLQPKQYLKGEQFLYLGKEYPLQLTSDFPYRVTLQGDQLLLGVKPSTSLEQQPQWIKKQLTAWYREQALQRLQERTAHFARVVGVKPASVVVRTYRSRWGSCSSRGDIRYNWKLIMGPAEVIDYVVVHELCHLLEHNHSPAYWRRVEQFMPDYREQREWLKRSGRILSL